jgi:prepilin-type N-terminal cleavage/methylation domain-containing protein
MKKQMSRGFTLVEIAIVLVIIGLLIGGVLRGQELLNSARINTISSQQSAIKTAYFGFLDRYKALPGDLSAAQTILINSSTAPASAAGDGNILLADSAAFFNNIAQAGFITCANCAALSIVTPGTGGAAATYTPPATGLSGSNTLVNVFGQPLVFQYNSGATAGSTAANGSSTAGSINFMSVTTTEGGAPTLTTGPMIASNLLAELDRKSDDGNPAGGSFRYTDIVATTSTAAPFVSNTASSGCTTGTAAAGFSWAVNPPSNCQGASLF